LRLACDSTISAGYSHTITAYEAEAEIELLEKLPEDVTWDQLMHEIYIRQSIEAGLADSKAGKSSRLKKHGRDSGYRRKGSVDRVGTWLAPGDLRLSRSNLTTICPEDC